VSKYPKLSCSFKGHASLDDPVGVVSLLGGAGISREGAVRLGASWVKGRDPRYCRSWKKIFSKKKSEKFQECTLFSDTRIVRAQLQTRDASLEFGKWGFWENFPCLEVDHTLELKLLGLHLYFLNFGPEFGNSHTASSMKYIRDPLNMSNVLLDLIHHLKMQTEERSREFPTRHRWRGRSWSRKQYPKGINRFFAVIIRSYWWKMPDLLYIPQSYHYIHSASIHWRRSPDSAQRCFSWLMKF